MIGMFNGSTAYRSGKDAAVRQKTLLVADDDAWIRSLIAWTLRPKYQVLEACDGLEVIGLMEIHPLPISLVISDIQMPNLGGLDVARWLRKRHPTVKLLLMSGECDGDRVKAHLGSANVPFLAKPFRTAALALTVQDLLSD
jgi:two-component system cell cycle sensor histidine kinase/response regulator CckA